MHSNTPRGKAFLVSQIYLTVESFSGTICEGKLPIENTWRTLYLLVVWMAY